MKSKEYHAEQILRELSADPLTRDYRVSPREVYPIMDSIVNDLASKKYFDNWEIGYNGLSEMYWTTWPSIEVTDYQDNKPSTLDMPSFYVDLPRNMGIQLIPLLNPDITVIITNIREHRLYKNTPAGDLQGKLAAYPIAQTMYFNRKGVKIDFGDMMVRMAVRTSESIAANQPYPIPADKELVVRKAVVEWFRDRLSQGIDPVRDNNLQRQ